MFYMYCCHHGEVNDVIIHLIFLTVMFWVLHKVSAYNIWRRLNLSLPNQFSQAIYQCVRNFLGNILTAKAIRKKIFYRSLLTYNAPMLGGIKWISGLFIQISPIFWFYIFAVIVHFTCCYVLHVLLSPWRRQWRHNPFDFPDSNVLGAT